MIPANSICLDVLVDDLLNLSLIHISPEITGDLTPASMSYEIVTGILRQQLNFEGVVLTDALGMGAIRCV